MIRPEDVAFKLRPYEGLFIVENRATGKVMTKVSFKAIEAMDADGLQLMMDGIIAIMNEQLPIGEPLQFHRNKDGVVSLVI